MLLVACAIMGTTKLSAQHFELGLMGGASNYQGDLVTNKSMIKETHAAFGGFARYNLNDWVAAKFNLTYGKISGNDSKTQNTERNLSFRSNILEFGLTGEFNILGFQPYNLERVFSPYIFAGVAMFKFNPQAELDGQWYKLQPLGTEGQGTSEYPDRDYYKLTQFSIPVGIGLKYALNDLWTLGFELGARKTFTDYLDDVSTSYIDQEVLLNSRGSYGEIAAALADRNLTGTPYPAGRNRGDSSGNKDWYSIAGITISYNFLDNGLVGSRGRRKGRMGCPTF
jgi:opacity protein-like surface antigen